MIYENKCIFLFKSDLLPEYRDISITGMHLKMFLDPNTKINTYLNDARLIAFLDTDKRHVLYMSGTRGGRVEKY
jgi:hypothetical protein